MSFSGGRPPYGMPGTFPPGMPQQFAPYGTVPPGVQVRPGVRMSGLLPTPPGTTASIPQPLMRPGHPPKIGRVYQNPGQHMRNNDAANQAHDEKPAENTNKPKTTVFVGNISERAPDTLVRALLGRCGPVLSWKRVQGASGKLQAFGFCEYGDPEASLRAIRLLHELELGDKRLLVKVDAKTRTLLDEYLEKKDGKTEADRELDDATLKEDADINEHIRRLLQDYSTQLLRSPDEKFMISQQRHKQKEEQRQSRAKDKIEDMNIEDDKKDLINREIDRFRQSYKDQVEAMEQKETPQEKEKSRKEREKERERDKQRRDQEKERERRDRERERDKERERERERIREEREREDRERERRGRDRDRDRDRSRDRDRDRDWERERERERGRGRDLDRDRDRLDEEEEYEKRKLERKLREKEEAYQERLRNWETRERKKQREYDKLREKEDMERGEQEKEGKRLKEFLEDYDDERDDPKYYKGSALERRRKEREKEEDADNRDRRREKEEIEDIKRRLEEEGREDLDAEIEKLESERDKHKQPQLGKIMTPRQLQIKQEPQPTLRPTFEPAEANGADHSNQGPHTPASNSSDDDPGAGGFQQSQESSPASAAEEEAIPTPKTKMTFGGLKLVGAVSPEGIDEHLITNEISSANPKSVGAASPPANSHQEQPGGNRSSSHGAAAAAAAAAVSAATAAAKRKKLTLGDVFNQEEDAGDYTGGKKRRKLVPIEYSEEEMKAVGQSQKVANAAEEKRKTIKNLIERIPTAKEELFAYKVDWNIVDESLMDRRIKPWINKKIVEYIGEEEPTLTEFICSKLLAHSAADSILSDITMVLDEEAEVFVVKMWRLLIYEVEAKKHGLVK